MPAGKVIQRCRANSASHEAGLFNQLEEDGVKYGITEHQDEVVKKVITLIDQRDGKSRR